MIRTMTFDTDRGEHIAVTVTNDGVLRIAVDTPRIGRSEIRIDDAATIRALHDAIGFIIDRGATPWNKTV